jgi:hypothetical protein
MPTLHVYKIDDGAQHWYVAASEDHALTQYIEDCYGGSLEDYRKDNPETTVVQCVDDSNLTITMDEDYDIDDPNEVTKTCAEWVEERGEGALCSSEW